MEIHRSYGPSMSLHEFMEFSMNDYDILEKTLSESKVHLDTLDIDKEDFEILYSKVLLRSKLIVQE